MSCHCTKLAWPLTLSAGKPELMLKLRSAPVGTVPFPSPVRLPLKLPDVEVNGVAPLSCPLTEPMLPEKPPLLCKAIPVALPFHVEVSFMVRFTEASTLMAVKFALRLAVPLARPTLDALVALILARL